MSNKWAALLAGLAVYGPQLVMAGYTLAYVSCSHCKQTVCLLLPVGPGLIAAELGRRLVGLPRPADSVWFASGTLISLAIWGLLAAALRTGRPIWTFLVSGLVLTVCIYAAAVTLALTRA
ncbi:MAG: hypothetical protein AB7U20_26035 [Planctomycetaceae bacterium]